MAWTHRESGSDYKTMTRARAGSTPHLTRDVLTVGLFLVIAIFTIIVLVGRP